MKYAMISWLCQGQWDDTYNKYSGGGKAKGKKGATYETYGEEATHAFLPPLTEEDVHIMDGDHTQEGFTSYWYLILSLSDRRRWIDEVYPTPEGEQTRKLCVESAV